MQIANSASILQSTAAAPDRVFEDLLERNGFYAERYNSQFLATAV